jgi:YD repeat-containing protein
VYDDYHRAVSETVLGKKQTKGFDLKAHTLNVDKPGQGTYFSKYDSSYRLLQASDSENRMVQLTYEEGQTRPKSISDCMGNQKSYEYDARGNIVRIRDQLGAEERFWYNQNDQLFAYLDSMGKAELYSYNEEGQIVKICHFAQMTKDEQQKGEVSFTFFQSFVTEYGYDASAGLVSWIKEGGELVKSFSYDPSGMLIAVSSPAGFTLHKSYDERGRLCRLWDQAKVGFEYSYDTRDRLVRVSSHEGFIEYRYDDIGHLSAMQDARGAITKYSYDALGNLLRIEDPLGGETRYEYDDRGNLKRIVLPNGSKHELTYDVLNRPSGDIW